MMSEDQIKARMAMAKIDHMVWPLEAYGLGGGLWGDFGPLHTIPKLSGRRNKPNPNAKKQAQAKRARKRQRRSR